MESMDGLSYLKLLKLLDKVDGNVCMFTILLISVNCIKIHLFMPKIDKKSNSNSSMNVKCFLRLIGMKLISWCHFCLKLDIRWYKIDWNSSLKRISQKSTATNNVCSYKTIHQFIFHMWMCHWVWKNPSIFSCICFYFDILD